MPKVYFNYNGNAEEAIEFYAKVLKVSKPEIMRWLQLPENEKMSVSKEHNNLVMHATMDTPYGQLMFADSMPGEQITIGNNISVLIMSKDKNELERLFNELASGGKINMPLGKTFWTEYYGMLTDKFGIMWQVHIDDE